MNKFRQHTWQCTFFPQFTTDGKGFVCEEQVG